MYERVTRLEQRAEKTDRRLRSIELTLENEISRNISIVAENHLNLTRKLDDVLKVKNEKEMTLVRINQMENDIRVMKEKAAGIV